VASVFIINFISFICSPLPPGDGIVNGKVKENFDPNGGFRLKGNGKCVEDGMITKDSKKKFDRLNKAGAGATMRTAQDVLDMRFSSKAL
jgi:hypothetical protein